MNAMCSPDIPALARTRCGLGLARLMRWAFDGHSLQGLAQSLIERASTDGTDAQALMDLSIVLQLQGLRKQGLDTLDLALQINRRFDQPSQQPTALRLLALMAPGDLMANAPVQFLIENSDVSLTMLYLIPGEPIPRTLPEHDVLLVAISDTQATHLLLQQLGDALGQWNQPVLLHPHHILRTSRALAAQLLFDAPGVCMPATAKVPRERLLQLCVGQCRTHDVLSGDPLPWIIRPLDSHAGHGLEKVDTLQALARYLDDNPQGEFYVSRFVDYSDADGQFRKYRVVLIDGVPYAGHMGVSSHWMVHYLNAGMTDSAAKRDEEARFMQDFDTEFAPRHAQAFHAIQQCFGLEYLVIDCAQTAQGELLVFEVDAGAVVHSMDPVDLFPYKQAAMQKVFAAFRALLQRTQSPQP